MANSLLLVASFTNVPHSLFYFWWFILWHAHTHTHSNKHGDTTYRSVVEFSIVLDTICAFCANKMWVHYCGKRYDEALSPICIHTIHKSYYIAFDSIRLRCRRQTFHYSYLNLVSIFPFQIHLFAWWCYTRFQYCADRLFFFLSSSSIKYNAFHQTDAKRYIELEICVFAIGNMKHMDTIIFSVYLRFSLNHLPSYLLLCIHVIIR